MIGKIDYIPFDAGTVPLTDSNLIEASAGTGKTYSIAILVLRLLLEEKITIREILMVTFTKAAVAELEERVRLFVRNAHKVSHGKEIKDKNITALVQRAINAADVETVQQKLKDALLFLDETSVLTIHSFCQQTLNEFAFETNQLFGTEMIPDINPVIEEELNKCWRKYITTMPVALLSTVWSIDLKAGIAKAIDQHLSGKKYFGYDDALVYTITSTDHEEWIKLIESAAKKETELREVLHDYVVENTESIKRNTSNTYAKKGPLPLIDKPKKFLEYIWDKRTSAYMTKSFPEILEQLELCDGCSQESKRVHQIIVSRLYCLFIREVQKGVVFFKLRNNLFSYDDMIQNLHKALVGKENQALVNALQEKYKAVFVDEFQDTDRQQFEIFDQAFGNNTILFYIGDPKQSIYAWRKADIFTYFKARSTAKHVYGMNQNYRSSAIFIAAMNRFFLPHEEFDTFFFGTDEEAIRYHPVESPDLNKRGRLLKEGRPAIPISVFRAPNESGLKEQVASQVALLLQDKTYSVTNNENSRAVVPSDIGILVRTGRQGRAVKISLAKLGIPAVTIDESKVLQSDEASYLLYLMDAMESPDRSSINRALLSPFTGFNTEDIILLDDEKTLGLFNKYKLSWQQEGIFTALMAFIADFGTKKILLQQHSEMGERILTNLLQLTELLHQVQSRKNLSMAELISWLKRGIDGMVTEGDEYVQRVESDEDAVKIVTIHKSKGLEYNIVLAPFLDFYMGDKDSFFSFRSPETGDYIGVEKSRITQQQQEWNHRQAEQENRRLLYVALTRTVYKCFIFKNEHHKSSTLSTFLNSLVSAPPSLIAFEKDLPADPVQPYRKLKINVAPVKAAPVHFQLLEPNWRKMSYTMLAAKGDTSPRARSEKRQDPYETFIMHTLKRGAKTGNLLHYIFENINFAEETHWERVIIEAIRRYVPGQQDLYLPMLRQLLQHVFNTEINIGRSNFTLASIDFKKRIAEFEFDFPVPEFVPDLLNGLSDDLSSIRVKGVQELSSRQLEGIMNGKMDLFFEHQGCYYILDWKSNYLGPLPEDYTHTALATTMNESNYHLQYLIYTLAAKKYLESRVPGFDYEKQFGGVIYLFVRGMRMGTDTGIFAYRPALSRILQFQDFF